MDVGGAYLRYTFINVQNEIIIESCHSPTFCLKHFKLKVPGDQQTNNQQQSDNNNNSKMLLPFRFINSPFFALLFIGRLVYICIRMKLMKINHIFVALFLLLTQPYWNSSMEALIFSYKMNL